MRPNLRFETTMAHHAITVPDLLSLYHRRVLVVHRVKDVDLIVV